MAKSRLHLMTDYKRLLKIFDSGAVFCAVDTETTGLKLYEKNPENQDDKKLLNRIIEIGAVKFNKAGLISKFDALINPGTSLPPFIKNLTHIDDEMLFEKPCFSDVSDAFLEFLENDEGTEETIIVAHNAQFDLRFLNAELENCGKQRLKNHAVDTLRLSRTAFPEKKSWTLQNLAADFKIKVLSAHRADDDARVCMEIFKKCLEETKRKKIEKEKTTSSLAAQALL